ncbi:MAG: hypothetical protein N2202_00405 [Proteobacteria bacterium]|nr:hypothetical protein [Pseudomonadota bacterium]
MKYFLILIFFILLSSNSFGYTIFLKNGKTFDAVEHKIVDGFFIMTLRNGNEIGFPIDDIDMSKTEPSIKAFEDQKKREEEAKRRRKEFEEKEKGKPKELLEFFLQEKRGMQLSFSEEEILQLIEFGERNFTSEQDFLKAYSFHNDYLPSIIYTKRLRLILYGVEKGKTKRQLNNNEIRAILEDPNLLILIVSTGDSPDALNGAEVFMKQADRVIQPFHLKVPAVGDRTINWPEAPAYYWKILVQFKYSDIDLKKEAQIVVKKGEFQKVFNIDFNYFR